MRRRDWVIVVRLVADIGTIFGGLLCLPAVVGLVRGETGTAIVLGALGVCFLFTAFGLRRLMPAFEVDRWHAVLAWALAWPFFSVVSAVPFILEGMPWVDALFECVSAWTDTGLTMVRDPATLPHALGLFRIFIQWVSGLGVVIFMLFGYRALDALFTVFSAQGNVGLSAMPAAAMYGMPDLLKVQLMVHMLLGRVEIFPFFSLLHVLRKPSSFSRR